PVAGVNLSLADSVEWAKSVGSRVTVWGPYRVKKELYEMAAAQSQRLSSRPAEYIVLDTKYRTNGATNCIHAVSDLDASRPILETGTAQGNEASEMVVDHFQPYLVPTQESMDWLLARLKLSSNDSRFATLAARR